MNILISFSYFINHLSLWKKLQGGVVLTSPSTEQNTNLKPGLVNPTDLCCSFFMYVLKVWECFFQKVWKEKY